MLKINGLETGLEVFRTLGSDVRMKIVQLLAEQGEMNLGAIASALDMTNGAVTTHIRKLEEAGLVVSRKEQYYTVYSLNRNVLEASLFDVAAAEPEQIDEQQRREEVYRQKVIKAFFEYGRLRAIPVQRKKKLICYELIAERFEPGRVYEEKEVNAIISPFYEDYCTIRRDLIGEGIFRRDGTRYVRLK